MPDQIELPEGEFAVLVGPCGCGKSTLSRPVAGHEAVDRGTIEIDGEVINEVRPRDRNVAIVFQNYALYPYMNVHENIAFDLRARRFRQGRDRAPGVPGGGDAGHCATARAPAAPAVGGQRQRAAIGRAIVRDARLFLFDEPLCNLDVKLRDEMRSEIKRLQTQLGNTMVYVTHDQVEAMTLADRIVLLKDGLIEQEGAPLDLFERPRTRFVAGFLGSPSMNFVPATLAGGNGRVEVRKRAGLAPLQVTVDLIQRPARAPPRPSASPAPRWWPSSRPTTSSARASSSRCRPA